MLLEGGIHSLAKLQIVIITFLKLSIDMGTVLATERHEFTHVKKEPLSGVEAVLLTSSQFVDLHQQTDSYRSSQLNLDV